MRGENVVDIESGSEWIIIRMQKFLQRARRAPRECYLGVLKVCVISIYGNNVMSFNR